MRIRGQIYFSIMALIDWLRINFPRFGDSQISSRSPSAMVSLTLAA